MEKYKEMMAELTAELESGKYPAGTRFPSEYALAERFNTTHITANKVVKLLVDKGWLVRGKRGEGTRVCDLGKLIKGQILYIGSLRHVTATSALNGLSNRAYFRGYYVVASDVLYSELDNFLAKALASRKFVGIVSNCSDCFDERCPGIPIVYLDHYEDYSANNWPAHNTVSNDNEAACHKLMLLLAERGYRNPVIYTDSCYQVTERYHRVRGFQRAMQELGIKDVDKRLFVGSEQREYTKIDALQQLRKILMAFPETDAIVTTADDLALPMRQALFELGIPSPGKILVTGFGNIRMINDVYQIPSVEQHPFHIGVAAADMLLDLVEKKLPPGPHLHVVDTELANLEFIPGK